MTRETKIGLLVGLAFIIVVGILLSDHMTAATERPAAALAEAGRGVQAGVTAPGVTTVAPPPIELPAVPAAPATAVQTPQVAIVPPQQQLPIVIQQQPAQQSAVQPLPEQPVAIAPQSTETAPIVTHTPAVADPFANPELVQTARQMGEPIVPVIRTTTPVNAPTTPGTPMAANNAREYKAQPGDTLSRIAALLPGGATKANRDAIVKLNPTLQKDPNKVIAGRTYLLPTSLAQAESAPLVQTPSPVMKKAPASEPAAKASPAATRIYVVQKGDTLNRIAASQLGSSKLASTILELNRDVLTDSNLIRVNMKLKLPASQG